VIAERSRWWRAALAVLLLGAGAACADNTDPDDPTILEIVNESDTVIEMVNYSACDDPEFGIDRLDPAEDVAPGASRIFEIEPGCYDMRVWFAGGEDEVRFDDEISPGQTFEWAVD
jgi:hypothetical protein